MPEVRDGFGLLEKVKPHCERLLGIPMCGLFSAVMGFALFFRALSALFGSTPLGWLSLGLLGMGVAAFFVALPAQVGPPRSFEGLQAGFLAGLVAAVLGGATYYGPNLEGCVTADPGWMLFRLLLACAPLGSILGWVFGMTLPIAPAVKREKGSGGASAGEGAPPQTPAERKFWLLVSFAGLILVLVFYVFVWTDVGAHASWLGPNQPTMLFRRLIVIVGCFAIAFTAIVTLVYSWKPPVFIKARRPAGEGRPILAALFWVGVSSIALCLLFPNVDMIMDAPVNQNDRSCRAIAQVSKGWEVGFRIATLFIWLWTVVALALLEGLTLVTSGIGRLRRSWGHH